MFKETVKEGNLSKRLNLKSNLLKSDMNFLFSREVCLKRKDEIFF